MSMPISVSIANNICMLNSIHSRRLDKNYVPKITTFNQQFRFEDEKGLSGHEYLYDLDLCVRYKHGYGETKLVKCTIVSVTDQEGEVALDDIEKCRIERWFVEVYQHTSRGMADLTDVLG